MCAVLTLHGYGLFALPAHVEPHRWVIDYAQRWHPQHPGGCQSPDAAAGGAGHCPGQP